MKERLSNLAAVCVIGRLQRRRRRDGTGEGGEERLTSVARTRLPSWSIVAHILHTSTSVVPGSKSRSLTDSRPSAHKIANNNDEVAI